MKRYIIIAAAVIVGAFGIYAGMRYRNDVYLPEKVLQEDSRRLSEQIELIRPDIDFDSDFHITDADVPSSENKENPLEKGEQLCDDMVAWLTIPDTLIDYPVVQGVDNDYYLHHSLDKSENQLGVPFLDCRCLSDFSGFNSIVYGHNFTEMQMFAQISSFKEREFLEQHNTGYLITDTDVKTVRFFAYLNVRSNSPVYHATFLTDDEKEDYLEMLYSEAVYTTNYEQVELTDKHLLLLSTCTYEFENARGVLAGVIEETEEESDD